MNADTALLSRVFAGTWLAYAGLYLCRKNFSVLMPFLSSELNYSIDELASLIFFYSLAYSCGQFLSGTLADRLGGKVVVVGGMLLSAGCTLLVATSDTLWVLAALQVVNGVAQSGGWPGLLKITAAWFEQSRRGVLMAWWTTNYVVGGFAATMLATWFATGPLSANLGWRGGAIGPAVLLTLLVAVFAILVTSRVDEQSNRRSPAGAWREVLSSPALWHIAASYFCLKLMRYTFLFWLPLYMVQRLGYSAGDAGYLSAAYELIGFIGVPLAGYLSDRVMGGQRFPVGAGMLFGLAIACFFFPHVSALGHFGGLAAIGIAGMLTFGPDTLLSGAATQDAVSPSAAATAGGFVNGVGSVGQLLSPFLVAFVVRRTGWDGLFGVFVAVSLVGAAVLAIPWNVERRAPKVNLVNA